MNATKRHCLSYTHSTEQVKFVANTEGTNRNDMFSVVNCGFTAVRQYHDMTLMSHKNEDHSFVELQKLWTEHQDADGDRVPTNKVMDIYWSAGFILGTEYSKKFEEELHDSRGRCLRPESVRARAAG